MFVAERLIFLELQKTGGSHIRRLLEQYIAGDTDGKHNRLIKADNNRLVIGSIRNPWDWYVSLWAYGVGGRGAIRDRTAKKLDFDYYYSMLPKAMGKNWITPAELFISAAHDIVKPVTEWQQQYINSADSSQFQSWLKLVLDKRRRFDIGEGYGFSAISKYAGLMTYRYFRLYTLGNDIFKSKELKKYSYIRQFDQKYNVLHGIIRNECLELDFISVLNQAGYVISKEDKASILKKEKTNVSVRRPTSYYYNNETRDLVANRERYIVEKYDYSPPF